MKEKLIARIQSLGRQANQLRQAVEAAPARAAQIRESVVLTVGQLHQLRSEIQTGITELRADNGDHLLKILGEIRNSTGVIRQAGFELTGVDLELGLTAGQRALLVLRKVEDVRPAAIRALVDADISRPALRGVLAALHRAVELADTVDLPGLEFGQLTIAVGPIPTIRIGWRAAGEPAGMGSASDSSPVTGTVSGGGTPTPPILSGHPWVTSSSHATPTPEAAEVSMFASPPKSEPVAPAPTPLPAPVPTAPASPVGSVSPVPSPTPPASTTARALGANWRAGALDRFKKMPDLHKTS